MTIHQHNIGPVVVLELDGRLVLNDGSDLLKDKVQSVVFQGHRELVLNLSGITYMDSAGLGELISAHGTISRAGGHVKLTGLTKRVSDLLAITKILTVFDTFDSEAEALRTFSAAT